MNDITTLHEHTYLHRFAPDSAAFQKLGLIYLQMQPVVIDDEFAGSYLIKLRLQGNAAKAEKFNFSLNQLNFDIDHIDTRKDQNDMLVTVQTTSPYDILQKIAVYADQPHTEATELELWLNEVLESNPYMDVTQQPKTQVHREGIITPLIANNRTSSFAQDVQFSVCKGEDAEHNRYKIHFALDHFDDATLSDAAREVLQSAGANHIESWSQAVPYIQADSSREVRMQTQIAFTLDDPFAVIDMLYHGLHWLNAGAAAAQYVVAQRLTDQHEEGKSNVVRLERAKAPNNEKGRG